MFKHPPATTHANYDPPGPHTDRGLRDFWIDQEYSNTHKQFRFGFKTLKQYREWQHDPEKRRGLAESDIRLRCYHVPREDVFHGDRQTVFRPDRAKLIEDRSPDYAD